MILKVTRSFHEAQRALTFPLTFKPIKKNLMYMKILERKNEEEREFLSSPSCRRVGTTARAEIQRARGVPPSSGSRKNRVSEGLRDRGALYAPYDNSRFHSFHCPGRHMASALSAGEKASPLPRPRWNDNENRFQSQPCKREHSTSLKFNPAMSSAPKFNLILHEKNDFAEGSKILLNTDLKINLLDHQNNFVGTLKIMSKKF